MPTDCSLCAEPGGAVLLRGRGVRVVAVDDADHPGTCRVVLERHAAEMSDLDAAEAAAVFAALLATERAVREVVTPDKINLASLGNLVPHLHWHVVPRWRDDPSFPHSIWSPPVRAAVRRTPPPDLPARLREALERSWQPR